MLSVDIMVLYQHILINGDYVRCREIFPNIFEIELYRERNGRKFLTGTCTLRPFGCGNYKEMRVYRKLLDKKIKNKKIRKLIQNHDSCTFFLNFYFHIKIGKSFKNRRARKI